MELQPDFQCVIGLDIHQAQVAACVIVGKPDGAVEVERRQFGAFKKDRIERAAQGVLIDGGSGWAWWSATFMVSCIRSGNYCPRQRRNIFVPGYFRAWNVWVPFWPNLWPWGGV